MRFEEAKFNLLAQNHAAKSGRVGIQTQLSRLDTRGPVRLTTVLKEAFHKHY